MIEERSADGERGGSAGVPALWPLATRLLTELGPLLVFFAGYKLFGFMVATAAFVVAVAVSTLLSWYKQGRLPLLPAFAMVVALITGGLTLGLGEERFLKMRPTLINALYGLVLLGSLLADKLLMKMVLEGPLQLTEAGWRGLSWRTGIFLIALAVANEVIWRTQPTALWVNFKVFAVLPLDILFMLSQWPFIRRQWCAPADDP